MFAAQADCPPNRESFDPGSVTTAPSTARHFPSHVISSHPRCPSPSRSVSARVPAVEWSDAPGNTAVLSSPVGRAMSPAKALPFVSKRRTLAVHTELRAARQGSERSAARQEEAFARSLDVQAEGARQGLGVEGARRG